MESQGRRDRRQGRRLLAYAGVLVAALLIVAGLLVRRPTVGTPMREHRDEPVRHTKWEATQMLPSQSPLPAHAVVYATANRGRLTYGVCKFDLLKWDVVLLPGRGQGPGRIVHSGEATTTLDSWLPICLGFLPSPDGQWLCVWETFYTGPDGGYPAPRETVWTVVGLSGDKRSEVRREPGLVGYLPSWLDQHRLQFERGEVSGIFDVRPGDLLPGLPKRTRTIRTFSSGDRDVDSDYDSAPAMRSQYLRRHLADERRVFERALRAHPTELQVSRYLVPTLPRIFTDVPDDMLLRPLGIVGRWGYRSNRMYYPSIAISPNHKLIARAGIVPRGQVPPHLQTGVRKEWYFEARVDVFEAASGRRLWGVSAPWSRALAEGVQPNPHHGPREPWFSDTRWSPDGRYLSLTRREGKDMGLGSVTVVDTRTWKEVLHIPNATDAFVIPMPK